MEDDQALIPCIEDDDATPPFLSLFPPLSENNNVIVAQPICPHHEDDAKSPTLSLFPQNISTSKSTLSLFPQVSENLAANSKHFLSNLPPPSPPPSTDLCLSLPYCTPDTSSTIISQHSSASSSGRSSSFHQPNIGPVLTRKGEDQNLVPIKKRRLILRPVAPAAALAVADEQHWIIKKLTKSDVNGNSRLLLPRQEVKTYVIPFLDEQKATDCQKLCGTDVNVWDLDTQSEYSMTLKKWATDSFQLIKNWTPYFVKRRNLKEDDVIALRWDQNNSRFCFRVRSRHDQVDNE